MTTPNQIRFWRQQKGWTLQQLAEAAGTTRAQIDKLERGSRRLTVDWMVRLATPLGCDPRSLMTQSTTTETLSMLEPAAMSPLYDLTYHTEGSKRSTQPSVHVASPYFLHNAHHAYGLIIQQKTLQPIIKAGQTVWVHPQADYHKGDLVVLTNIESKLYIGHLQSKNSRHITLQWLSPRPKLFKFACSDVATLERIIAIVSVA
jgi:transcriptional regulator with XRE-family HTH domain